jgi:hypothetical protein
MATVNHKSWICLIVMATSVASTLGFSSPPHGVARRPVFAFTASKSSSLHLFDKMFEEEGMLGKGITVGKVQVGLFSSDRSADSVYKLLERKASNAGDAPEQLARLANDVCLTLMRKSDDWISACSTSKWFSEKDAGKAESYYNDLANAEAIKYEKVRRNDTVDRVVKTLS